jgi:tRNA(fMet)-specific endonuclease VapC
MYLLDTDTLIYFLKGHDAVVRNFKARLNTPKAISVVTYGELVYGCRKSQRAAENLARVRRLAELYPLVDVTRAVMDSFAEIKAALSAAGTTVDDFDLVIGCTALTLNYAVVTNNARHFEKIPGLHVVNWTLDATDD